MPVFFFDLCHSTGTTRDERGVSLADEAATLRYAEGVVRDIARNNERRSRTFSIVVRDEADAVVFTLPFSTIDEAIGVLSDPMRATVETNLERRRALQAALQAARVAMRQSRATVARSRGKPYLATAND